MILGGLTVAVVIILIAINAGARARADQAARLQHLSEIASSLAQAQTTLSGRMEQAQSDSNQRLDALSKRLGDSLTEQTERTGQTLKVLHERLALIDHAQKNITELSQQMVSLQDILSNKQARGAFGEIQLNDLVTAALPASAYTFQATLSNGKRADCLLQLPNPPGPIAIDSKFPLESYETLRNAESDADKAAAGREFSAAVLKHVKDISERYILPGETSESALLFLPSEAVYAELHANFRNVVEEGFRRRVWIVSPTTLMATLNTVRAILRDVHMREQADVIQAEVHKLLQDVSRLDDRVGKLKSHFNQAQKDIGDIEISSGKIMRRGARIEDLQLGDGEEAAGMLSPPDGKAAE
ncbi:MAG: DNA recombination protein RmuC [Rhodospirillales bacterium]|nr:DNA recombination protein RmuC [Rhodospirillales bacterium]MBO6787917.1 DNA recombination protein RmuC [Rhodospirillales bacterium]